MFLKSLKKVISTCLILCLVPTIVFANTTLEQEPNSTFENAMEIGRWSIYKGNISKNPGLTIEREPNNCYDTAMALMPSCNGTLENNDSDYYYFDVTERGTVGIEVTNAENIYMNWVVYKESDLDNYCAFPQTYGEILSGSFEAEPGRYYVGVYTLSESTNYSITVDGPIISGDIDTYKIIPGDFTLPMGPGDIGVDYCNISVKLEIEDQNNDFDLYVYNESGVLVNNQTYAGNDIVEFFATRGDKQVYYIQVVPKVGFGSYKLDISKSLPPVGPS